MTTGVKAAIGMTVVLVAAVGIRVALIYRHNHAADGGPDHVSSSKMDSTTDDLVYIRKLLPDSIADEKQLIGKTVWMQAGYQLDYYKDTGHHVDYAHPVGSLAPNQAMVIREVFEQVPPHSGRAVFRVPAGQRHVLLGFTMPDAADPKQLYATPVGYYSGGYTLYNDNVFFYDDPHVLYKHWSADVWAHIDKREVMEGMNERQVMMCLGEAQTLHGGTYGNRSTTFDNNGHPVSVDFQKDKVVHISKE